MQLGPGRGDAPPAIRVRKLAKHFSVHRKAPGLIGSIKGLVKRDNHLVRAVDGVSFDIREGEIVGFLGPNGAGKTTTLKLLSGLLFPTSGETRVLGHDPWRRDHVLLRQLSLVMGQKNQLWWDIPARETFLLNKEIYEIPDSQYQQTVDDLVDLLDLGRVLDVPVRRLSLGERMKCELATALLHRPRVLFLDEPTIGLDIVAQKSVRQFIDAYRKRHRATIILTSHYMDDVQELCERVIVIDHGRVIHDGPLAEVVATFAGYRVVGMRFDRPVDRVDVEVHGTVATFDGTSATLHLPRDEVSVRAAQLLSSLPVADLTIEEPSIDDVIRKVFATGRAGRSGASDLDASTA